MTKGWKRNTRKISKKCLICKNEFEDYISNNRKFCSKECFYKSGSLRRKTFLPITEETRKKMSLSHKGKPNYWLKGKPSHRRGKHLSESHKKRIGLANKNNPLLKRLKGKMSPHWKGGYQNKLHLNRKRRMIKNHIIGSHTLKEWELLKKKYHYACLMCGKKEPEIRLTEDHIIPITDRNSTNNIENIQPLCPSCNSKKRNFNRNNYKEKNEFIYPSTTRGLFKDY